MNEKIEVLDKGFVEVLGFLGTDLTVANSARVSFGKKKIHMIQITIILLTF